LFEANLLTCEIPLLIAHLETPKRGQSVQCPDRLLAKSGGSFRQIFWE